ncbi:MAG: hypothetical protein ACI35S_08300 [Anaeroplasma sp.]
MNFDIDSKDRYLPRANYNNDPILYITNGMTYIYVYSFDRKKRLS